MAGRWTNAATFMGKQRDRGPSRNYCPRLLILHSRLVPKVYSSSSSISSATGSSRSLP